MEINVLGNPPCNKTVLKNIEEGTAEVYQPKESVILEFGLPKQACDLNDLEAKAGGSEV